jgi:hypothetical protein
MLDYQFLGMVAVVLAVVTRGSLLPVVAVTALIGLVTLACETTAKSYRRRHPRTPRQARPAAAAGPAGGELTRWMAAVERILGSPD